MPQIFFNKHYVGGNRELQDIISSQDQEKWNSLLQEVVLYIVDTATLLGFLFNLENSYKLFHNYQIFQG